MADTEPNEPGAKPLPPPWDRIFSLGTRIFVWGLLFGILYLLRPFLLLVFLTFVFAYILEHGTQGLQHRIRNRPLRVVLVSVVFLGTLVTLALALRPSFVSQATTIARDYPRYLATIDAEIATAREKHVLARNILPGDVRSADVLEYMLGFVQKEDPAEVERHAAAGVRRSTDPVYGKDFIGPTLPYYEPEPGPDPTATTTEPPPEDPGPPVATDRRKENLAGAVALLENIASPILGIGSAFLLSLLFSFLIVLDLPKLSRAVKGLAGTKIGFIYDEAAGNIHDFGMMLGRALEAQLFIAICNTILTAVGLFLLGLTTNLVFLAIVVFFFSFIPVAGVFLSSVPICLTALSDTHGGFQLMLLAILMITIIHFIEAYFLNPRIFGHHLHMNPVLVLIVLTIGGKLFGVWGLVIGLPVVNYVFGRAIRYKHKPAETPPAEIAA